MTQRPIIFHTLPDAAKLAGVSAQTLKLSVLGGRIQAIQVGEDEYRIPAPALAAYITELTRGQ